jgi:hypothetical protein
MGTEARCVGHFNRRSSEGKALLETDYLLFRGDFRVKVPLKGIQELAAADGQLSIGFDEGTLLLDLGAAAEKWMRKIQNPPSLIDKLGVKEGAVVSVIGISDEDFLTALHAVAPDWKKLNKKRLDFIFLGIESQDDLGRMAKAEAQLEPAGALWVVWPKGQKHITQSHVMAAGKAAGLVDTKTASFSVTHTALKMVIPVARRAAGKN